MGFMDWAFGATPGQQAGQFGKEVVTGIFDGVGKIIDEFHVSAEEKTQMKIAIAEQKLKAVELLISDVQNARQMQIQTHSVWPGVMSTMAGLGFFGGFIVVLMHGLPDNLDEFTKSIIYMFAGAMVSAWTSAQNFWMGSTMGSQNKDHLLHQSQPVVKE